LPADPAKAAALLAFNRQLLSYRQTAEWGNRALQGCFGRLRVPLEIGHQNRCGEFLENVVRQHNLHTRRIGINQICNVYMPLWHPDEQDQLWYLFRDMMFSDQ
jgi:hypothetical protein